MHVSKHPLVYEELGLGKAPSARNRLQSHALSGGITHNGHVSSQEIVLVEPIDLLAMIAQFYERLESRRHQRHCPAVRCLEIFGDSIVAEGVCVGHGAQAPRGADVAWHAGAQLCGRAAPLFQRRAREHLEGRPDGDIRRHRRDPTTTSSCRCAR